MRLYGLLSIQLERRTEYGDGGIGGRGVTPRKWLILVRLCAANVGRSSAELTVVPHLLLPDPRPSCPLLNLLLLLCSSYPRRIVHERCRSSRARLVLVCCWRIVRRRPRAPIDFQTSDAASYFFNFVQE